MSDSPLHDEAVHEPATAQDLIDAGLDPDDWRGPDGKIIGHDLPPGPLAEGIESANAEEMPHLLRRGTEYWGDREGDTREEM